MTLLYITILLMSLGRYGQVWLGKFKDDQNVAIKVFKRLDEENWSKEMYIYDLPLISHRNIVGFLAAHDNGYQLL